MVLNFHERLLLALFQRSLNIMNCVFALATWLHTEELDKTGSIVFEMNGEILSRPMKIFNLKITFVHENDIQRYLLSNNFQFRGNYLQCSVVNLFLKTLIL